MIKSVYVTIALLVIVLICGCSGSNITSPPDLKAANEANTSTFPIWVSDFTESGNPESGLGILGLFSCAIDKTSMTSEITSLRKASLEDVLEVVDITNFLQLAPCTDCVDIKRIQLDGDGNLVVSIGIRHPFEPGDPLKPITGRNRADLHVFNVEGIVVSDGAATTGFPSLGVTTGGFKLLNADGYTSYLDLSLDEILPTESDIHPFITHFADYSAGNFDPGNPMGFASVTDPPPSGNLVMPMGSDEDVRDYVFDLQDGDISFTFAVGCTYAVSSASKSQRFTPEYRAPQHNKKAASFVNVIIDNNELEAGETTSEAQLTIQVLDINHGIPVGTALNEMKADSSVSKIEIEVLGVTSGAVTFPNTPTGGDGRDPMNPLTFTGKITNALGAPEGSYFGVVKVTDAYPSGLNASPLLMGMDGIKRVSPIENPLTGLFTIPEFATYQVFQIPVLLLNEAPVAILAPDPARACDGGTIWFNGTASYDPDGTIETYEFDFDLPGGDPLNFSADISGTQARVESTPYAIGNYTAALRVFDDNGDSSIDTVPVTVTMIDGFDVSPYSKVYITDTTFSPVMFTPNGFDPNQTQNRQYGIEAMDSNSDYIYAVFYSTGTSGTGVYMARSMDNGATWDDYKFIHPLSSGATYCGTAIDVVDEEVFILVGETSPQRLFLNYNDNNGDGSFTEYVVSTTRGYASISIAVDENDTDNIYACAASGSYYQYLGVYTSNTGPSGTFTEVVYPTWYRPPPFGYYTQGYHSELRVATDGDVYFFETANASLAVQRSDNHGASFTEIYGTWDPQGSWGRDSDVCMNPNDPNMIHWVTTYRSPGAYRHSYRRSIDGGYSWSVLYSNLHGTTTGYTNCSVTTDKNANVYIVYTDKATGDGEVYGRYSNANGSNLTPFFQISSDPLNDGHVEITQTTDGCDVIVGWLEDRDGARRVVSRRG